MVLLKGLKNNSISHFAGKNVHVPAAARKPPECSDHFHVELARPPLSAAGCRPVHLSEGVFH